MPEQRSNPANTKRTVMRFHCPAWLQEAIVEACNEYEMSASEYVRMVLTKDLSARGFFENK